MRAILLITLLWFTALAGFSQQHKTVTDPQHERVCGTGNYAPALLQQYPNLVQRQQEVMQAVQESLTQSRQLLRLQQQQPKIIIPVVFHVVYNTQEENISDQQVLSQLAILNADFRRRNADTVNTPDYFKSLAADTGIEFCLASLDPQGNPTTGITRTRTTKTAFSSSSHDIMSSSTGGTDIWDRNQYLNIWIGRLNSIAIGEVVGYANPPGSPAELDGVVLHYNSVGAPPSNTASWPYNHGRTATHEIGHWLGLQHIWGTSNSSSCSDTDSIDDTPNQGGSTTGCPNTIVISCGNGPYGNMWQNYMDYTDDACMNLFTKGQAAYMQAVLNTARASILTSPACTGNIIANFELANPLDTLIAAGTTVTFKDKSIGTRPASWLWQFEGGTPATSTAETPSVIYNKPGRFSVSLTVTKNDLSDTETKTDFIEVTVSDLTVYPNPATDVLVVEQQARTNIQQVEIINRIGQVVLQQEVNERIVELRVGHLPAGIYFLRIQSTTGIAIKKVVVVR